MQGDPPSRPTNSLLPGEPSAPFAGGTLTFDSDKGRIASIDGAALKRLGLAQSAIGAGLDSQMPALVRLRELARSGLLLDGPRTESLVFWSEAGAKRIPCRISQASSVRDGARAIRLEFEADAERPTLVKDLNGHRAATAAPELQRDADAAPLESSVETPDEQPQRPASSTPEHSTDEDEQPPPPVRDDAATLRNIGQQIRNGMRPTPDIKELAAANERVPLPDYLVRPLQNDSRASSSTIGSPVAPAEDLAALADAELSSRLSRAAHEIKTPLSAIAAASEVIRDEHLGPVADPRYRAYAEGIYANARHALNVVDRILKEPPSAVATAPPVPATEVVSSRSDVAVSLPQRQRLAVAKPVEQSPTLATDLASVNVNDIIEATGIDIELLAERQGVRVSAWPDANVKARLINVTEFKQALLNLVTNALKFTPHGGTIMLETHDMPGHGVTVSVRDTGRGMTRAMAARLVDPSLDPNPGRHTATGHGLGYQQIRSFVASHNARLHIDSTLGKGSCVMIIFPAQPE